MRGDVVRVGGLAKGTQGLSPETGARDCNGRAERANGGASAESREGGRKQSSDLEFGMQREQRIETSYEGSGNGGISALFSAPLPRNKALFSLGTGGLDLTIITTFSAHPVSCPSYQTVSCPVRLRHQPVRADGETGVTCAATSRAPAVRGGLPVCAGHTVALSLLQVLRAT